MVEKQEVISFGMKLEATEYKERPAAYAVIMNKRHEVAVVRSRGMLFFAWRRNRRG
ncbi:hypothetical protein [Paenibacillus mesotrionivorans]|uniref:Uncharacterized protein n=1 Tax=Paenibacillus mesotrionivorans TaxID=3160968 RepID=A0ACC7NRL8_9BACL